MEAFRNLDVWKRACRLSADLYEHTSICREHRFKQQVTQAGLSVVSNIAEGYQHNSVDVRMQYLNVAKCSCGKIWSQLMIGRSAGLMNPEDFAKLELEASEISRMLWLALRQLRNEQEKEHVTRA